MGCDFSYKFAYYEEDAQSILDGSEFMLENDGLKISRSNGEILEQIMTKENLRETINELNSRINFTLEKFELENITEALMVYTFLLLEMVKDDYYRYVVIKYG